MREGCLCLGILTRLGLSLGLNLAAQGADLPYHRPLRILIVSDEVNPHGLSAAELTQPGDLSRALSDPANGLRIATLPNSVREIPTDQIEQATAALSVPFSDPLAYDVLIYFAHRIPNGANALTRQQQFTQAVEQFLVAGGGVISFHHGSYFAAGKEGVLDLIGATATGHVSWNTVEGQDVINVAPGHFVACYGLSYAGSVSYSDPPRGVAADSYPFFNNTPDERYPTFNYNANIGPHQMLFASNYLDNGATHILGFEHRRTNWIGRVLAYQPGEYEPNALDIRGRNFQVLANAILYSSTSFDPDDIVLRVERGPGPGEVQLSWSGCHPLFSIYRSATPQDVANPSNRLGTTTGNGWTDSSSNGEVSFYLITP
jgi:hypothetical protein